MAKTLEDILKAVGEEDAGVVRAAIQTEKDRGIESSRSKGKEVEKHLTELNRLRDFLRDKLEFDLDKDLDEQLEEARKSAGETGEKKGELEKQIASLTKRIETLTKEVGEKDKLANEKAEKLRVTKLVDALRRTIGNRVHSSDYVIKGLVRDGMVKLLDDEETVVFMENGEEVAFDKGVQNFLKANPEMVKNSQTPGSGSDGSHTSSGEKVMKRSDFDKLSASERSAKVKEGFKLTD